MGRNTTCLARLSIHWRIALARSAFDEGSHAMAKVRVALVGVGNCASSLVQGVRFYANARDDEFVPGLMHVNLGGYRPADIEFSAAFDVSAHKVGLDLGEAIYAEPNNTIRFADVPDLGVKVHRGMTHDGIGQYLKDVVPKAPGSTD